MNKYGDINHELIVKLSDGFNGADLHRHRMRRYLRTCMLDHELLIQTPPSLAAAPEVYLAVAPLTPEI